MTNPTGSDINFYPDDVMSALFGEVKLRVDAEPHRSGPGGRGQRERRGAGARGRPARQPASAPPAAVALYGLPNFPRVDVYDLSGVFGFTGTPVPRTMFDGDDDRWFGFLGEHRFGQLAWCTVSPAAAPGAIIRGLPRVAGSTGFCAPDRFSQAAFFRGNAPRTPVPRSRVCDSTTAEVSG